MTAREGKRQLAEQKGRRAELLSALRLMVTGHHILARRYRCVLGEIDLIARRGKTILFVEVKARPTCDEALYAITPHQQNRISRAAEYYLAHHPRYTHYALRFDAMVVSSERFMPMHVRDAFRPQI